jgi:uncharacterized damage-inducible protein DinB
VTKCKSKNNTMEILTLPPFLEYIEKIRERTSKLIAVIPPGYMDWTYKPGKFTIADQVRHIAAIERYMYAENVAGRKSTYNGCGKELADGYENVLAFFREKHKESVEIFRSLKEEDLQKKCSNPAGIQITIAKWLRLMTEHEIHHRGELYIYLNLLGIKTPPMFGMTSEEVIAANKNGNSVSAN